MGKKRRAIFLYLAITIYLFITLINLKTYFSSKSGNGQSYSIQYKIKLISCDNAYDKYLNYKVFIDVRDENSFKFNHIAHSVNYPFYRKEEWISLFFKKFNFDDTLIVYCDSDICSLAINAGGYLIKKGYKNIYILKGGIDRWNEKKLPIINYGD